MHVKQTINKKLLFVLITAVTIVAMSLCVIASIKSSAEAEQSNLAITRLPRDYTPDAEGWAGGKLSGIVEKYYSSELKAIESNMKFYPGYDKNNKAYLRCEKRATIFEEQNCDGDVERSWKGTNPSLILLTHDFMPDGNVFEKDNPWTVTAPESSQVGLGTLQFLNAGTIRDTSVDMFLRFNSISISSWKDDTGNKYGVSKDKTVLYENPDFLIASIGDKMIKDYIVYSENKSKYSLEPLKDHETGTITFYAESGMMYTNISTKVEIDYSIGIIESGTEATPYKYPVYSAYTDLDVQKAGAEGYFEGITPISNVNNVVYAFDKSDDETDPYIDLFSDDVRSGYQTIRANCMKTGASDNFPQTWQNTGAILVSDPSETGYYNAIWRGNGCGTCISLAPCDIYALNKSVKKDVAEFGKTFNFTLDYELPVFDSTIFDPLKSCVFDDELPKGLNIEKDSEGNLPIKVVTSKKGQEDVPITSNTSIKYEDNKLTVSINDDWLKEPSHYDGSTLKVVFDATVKSYDGGKEAEYEGSDPELSGNCWRYQNTGKINLEGLEITSNTVDVYTPLYGKTYKFYDLDSGKELTSDAFENAKPDSVIQSYKVNQEVESLMPKTLFIDANNNQWAFVAWKDGETSYPSNFKKKCELDKLDKDGNLTFTGYWREITNDDGKIYDVSKTDTCVTDASPVHVGDSIAYELTGTNKTEAAADLVFVDSISTGLDFNDDCQFKCSDPNYDLSNISKTISDSTVVTYVCKNLPRAATVQINYTSTVNDKATDIVTNTLVVNSQSYTLTNPLIPDAVKIYNEEATEIIHDGSAVKVGDKIAYKIIVANDKLTKADIYIHDTMSKGLEYVPGSSKANGLKVDDPVDNYMWKFEDVPSAGVIELTYDSVVTKDAVNQLSVKNGASYVIDDKEVQLNELVNPLKVDVVQSLATGDYKIWSILALFCLSVVAGTILVCRYRKSNS